MERDEKYRQLEEDLRPFCPLMGQAADCLLDEGISRYPIFVVSKLDIELGIPLKERESEADRWAIHLSTLEELVARKVVSLDRVDTFRGVYKDAEQFFCLFTLSDLGAQFIFMPR